MIFGYTDCFDNLTIEEKLQIYKDRADQPLMEVFRFYYGWMVLPLAILSCILTPIFILVVMKAVRQHHVSRKVYLLLANRSLGDLLSSVVQLVSCFYFLTAPHPDGERLMIFISMYIGSFWSAMVSYIGISLVKLFAVWRPLEHRKSFTMDRCLLLISFSWVVYAVVVLYGVIGTILVEVPWLAERSGCRAETCLRFVYRSRHYITIFVYFTTLIVFVVTVIVIQNGRKNVIRMTRNSENSTSSVRSKSRLRRHFPLWKLGLNIATFAVFQGFYVGWCIFNITIVDRCYMIRHSNRMQFIISFVMFSLTLRIVMDHVIPFVTDKQLRRCLVHALNFTQSEMLTSSSGREPRSPMPPRASSLILLHAPHRTPTTRTVA